MVSLGRDHGVDSVALLTSMESPLGNSAGNALEVAEAVEVLAGGGPHDLIEVTVALATEMLSLVGLDVDPRAALADGSALDVWRHMVAAQGGDPDAPLPKAKHVTEIRADRSGVLSRLDAHAIGVASWRLGAGRARKEDPVSATAGVLWHARPGEHVRAGDVLIELHTDDETRVARASEALQGAVEIGGDDLVPLPLVIERIA
jgi:thymidine phosphorylase